MKWEKLCKDFSDGSVWSLKLRNTIKNAESYTISYKITKYEYGWEPLVVLPNDAPNFQERFIGYGKTRNSMVREQIKCCYA